MAKILNQAVILDNILSEHQGNAVDVLGQKTVKLRADRSIEYDINPAQEVKPKVREIVPTYANQAFRHLSSTVEQGIRNAQVRGSNPRGGSYSINGLRILGLFTFYPKCPKRVHPVGENVYCRFLVAWGQVGIPQGHLECFVAE